MTSVVIRHSLSGQITEVLVDGVKQTHVVGAAFYATWNQRVPLFKLVTQVPGDIRRTCTIPTPDIKVEYVP